MSDEDIVRGVVDLDNVVTVHASVVSSDAPIGAANQFGALREQMETLRQTIQAWHESNAGVDPSAPSSQRATTVGARAHDDDDDDSNNHHLEESPILVEEPKEVIEGSPAPRQKRFIYWTVGGLAIVLLATGGILVALIATQQNGSKNSPTATPALPPQGTSTDSLIPIPAPSPSVAKTCSSTLSSYEQCLNTVFSTSLANTCIECVIAASTSSNTSSCESFQNDFCPALINCNCGECADDMQNYIACVNVPDCSIDCTPRPQDRCQYEESTYLECKGRLPSDQSELCSECSNAAIFKANWTSCTRFNDSYCANMESCNCGVCAEDITRYVDCRYGGLQCDVNCTEPTDPADKCAKQRATYERCFDHRLYTTEQESCMNCVWAALNTSTATEGTCDDFRQAFCPSFKACEDCKECLPPIEEWADCQAQDRNCFVDCGTTPLNTCTAQEKAYRYCFESDLTSGEAESCSSCFSDALSASSLTVCADFKNVFCPAYAVCADCGTCTDEVLQFVDCIIDYQGGCRVTCKS